MVEGRIDAAIGRGRPHEGIREVQIFAVINQKGGSGKTTTAVNLAAALGELDKRVLVVDLDPQASASSWLGVKDGGRGLLDAFTDEVSLTSLVREASAPGVDIIPSSAWLANAEKAMAGEVGAELMFRKAVKKLSASRWDFVLVDCPPALGLLTVSALTAVGKLLVPVEAHVMALAGLPSLLQTVDLVRDRLNGELKVSSILACRVDARTNLSRDVVNALRAQFGRLVFKNVIRENVRLAEAPSFAKPITLYSPRSAGSEDYRAVAAELLKRR